MFEIGNSLLCNCIDNILGSREDCKIAVSIKELRELKESSVKNYQAFSELSSQVSSSFKLYPSIEISTIKSVLSKTSNTNFRYQSTLIHQVPPSNFHYKFNDKL
jgi:hypothetical protein